MAKKYFVWKNGNPQEWQELTGKEYYALTESDAVKGRYFVKMNWQGVDDDMLFIESTKEIFDENIKDKNRVEYLEERDAPYSVESLSTLTEKKKDKKARKKRKRSDRLIDHRMDVEAGLKKKLFFQEVSRFKENLKEIDQIIFEECILIPALEKKRVTQLELSKKLGISASRLSQRKNRICELFKNFCSES